MSIVGGATVFVIAVLVCILLLPAALLFGLWRYCWDRRLKSELGSHGEICKLGDAYWNWLSSPELTNNIVFLFMLKGYPDVQQLQNEVVEKLVFALDENGSRLFPKATRYMTYRRGRPVWMDDLEFDIKYHVFSCKTNSVQNEQELKDMIGYLISEPLPENKARWQFILVPYTTNGLSPMIFRWHHSVGDGAAWVNLFKKQCAVYQEEQSQTKSFVFKNQIRKTIKAIFQGPYKVVTNSAAGVESNIIQSVKPSRKKLVAFSKGYKLNFFKRLKSAVGSNFTVNDIIMAAVSGSLRKFFVRHESRIPKNALCLVATNLRKPGGKLILDNQLTGMFLSLPTNISDPLKMLLETKDRMDTLKKSGDYLILDFVLKLVLLFLPNKILPSILKDSDKDLTLTFSSVPPLQTKLNFAGKTVEKMIQFGSPPGLIFMATTYCDEITMATMVDNNLQVDPSVFVKGFEETLYQLAEQLGVVEDD